MILLLTMILLLAPAAAFSAELLSVPTAMESRVVVGHSFEQGSDQPEQFPAAAKLAQVGGASVADGFIGKGFKVPDLRDKTARPLTIAAASLSPDKPLTIMLWWRLDAELPETGGFGVIWLRCPRAGGYISCFVRGKGEWCALARPTWVYQFYNFPGMTNENNIWTGKVVAKAGEWHHATLTIANAKEVSWYRDGELQSRLIAKGRDLAKDETSLVELGAGGHPMTIDEILVLDRALSPAELADYVKTSKALSEMSK